MNVYSLPPLVVAIFIGALGIFVLIRNPRSDVNRALFATCLCHFVWLFFDVFLFSTDSLQVATTLSKIIYSGVTFIAPTFYHFILRLLRMSRKHQWLLSFYYFTAVVVTLLIWTTPLFISGMTRYFWGFYPLAGPLHPLYLAWFISSAVIGFGLLIVIPMTHQGGFSREDHKRRIQLVRIGLMVDWIACIDFLTNYGIEIYPAGYLFSGFMVSMMAYAIVRHNFLDIRVAITRTSLLLGTYIIILGVPFMVGWFFQLWLIDRFSQQWWLIPLGLCTILATIGPFAYANLRRQAEARLLKDQQRYQRTLQLAARGMTQVRHTGRLSQLITRLISRTVGITHASLFLWNQERQCYSLRASHGPKRLSLQSWYGLESSHPLIAWLQVHQRILLWDELASKPDSLVFQELEHLSGELIVPGMIERRLLGFLVLGTKRSGDHYSADDLHAFNVLGHQAAMALENAISYEELLKANDQIKAASERLLLQERLVAAGQFAAGMAHEIKNPLSSIKTFAQFLPEKYDDPAFRERFFRIVQNEIDRINNLVEDLLDFAKPAPLELQPVQLSDTIGDIVLLLSDKCLKQKVEVRTRLDLNGSTIYADPQQLKQVLLNLCLNSLEAMPRGGQLKVSSELSNRFVKLRIDDTGCGIVPENLAHVWDPFFTTKERGMGLGMAIVKSAVERHGGQISISSSPGKGTTVEIALPLTA